MFERQYHYDISFELFNIVYTPRGRDDIVGPWSTIMGLEDIDAILGYDDLEILAINIINVEYKC